MNPASYIQANWRKTVALCFLALLAWGDLFAQRRGSSSPLDSLGEEVSQAEGLEILGKFRRLGLSGDFRLSFQLKIMPWREKTRYVPGLILGTRSEFGPLSRVDVLLEPARLAEDAERAPALVHRLLLQNGLFANALESRAQEAWALVDPGSYLEPIAGSDFAVFDLLMPFTYWQRFDYEGRTKLRGRPVHVFYLYPPKEDSEILRQVSKVRIYLDEEFSALNRVQVFDPDGELVRTMTIVAFRLVKGQAVLSQVDVRDERKRSRTRLRVLDAALDVEVPPWVFEPEGLLVDVFGTDLALLRAAEEELESPR